MRKPDPVFPEEVKEKEKSDFRRFTSEFERGYGRGGGGGGGGEGRGGGGRNNAVATVRILMILCDCFSGSVNDAREFAHYIDIKPEGV